MLINYCCCQVSIIEFDIRKFIDDVFKTVRSAEVAFDTVVTFQHISTRDSVSAVMKTKFADVLDRYDKQVGTISSPSCWGGGQAPSFICRMVYSSAITSLHPSLFNHYIQLILFFSPRHTLLERSCVHSRTPVFSRGCL